LRSKPSDDTRIPGTSLAEKGKKRVLLIDKRFLHYFATRGKIPSGHSVAPSVNNTIFPKA